MIKKTKNLKERTNPLKDLLKLLNNKRKKLHIKQLLDGTVYVYDNEFMLASFKYFGGTYVTGLRLNTKKYIGRSIYNQLRLYRKDVAQSTELGEKLKELLPFASQCVPKLKHALELSIIESAICDTDSEIEVYTTNKFGFGVEIINNDRYVSIGFKYLYSGKLKNVFLRYSPRQKDIRIPFIVLPFQCKPFFINLMNRPIVDSGTIV